MWRNLIMTLVLANLLLLAWGSWIVAPNVADPRAFGDSATPQLVLLERVVRTDAIGATSPDQQPRCFRLGPFSSADAAADVERRLSARQLPVNRYSKSGQVWVGHWVQVVNQPSVEVARQAVKALVRGGIADAYISSRDPVVSISLGVYRGRRGADDVIRLASDLGYTAVATDRFRDGMEYWVEVATPADRPPDLANLRLAAQPTGGARIVRIEEMACRPTVVVGPDGGDIDGDAGDVSLESQVREDGSSESSTLPE